MNKSSYNEKSDIWSLGCVLYELCTLRPPFLASNQRELALKIRSGHFSKIPSRYSKELSKLIDQMLNVECMHRPSIDELLISPSVSKFTQNKADKCDGDASLKKAVDLTQREAACDKKEAHLRIKEAELAEREIKLQNQEKEIQQRLEMLQEREDYLKKISISKQDMKNLMDDKPELTDKPLTPILCRDRKGVESPSKHVSFKVQDKENDITSIQTAFASRNAGSNLYGLREYDKNSYDFQKRMELRDRLEKAKQRANQLRIAEIETRVKSSNFLNIR